MQGVGCALSMFPQRSLVAFNRTFVPPERRGDSSGDGDKLLDNDILFGVHGAVLAEVAERPE